jgi:uncharacterized protein (TIGR03084 family)
MDIRSLVRDLAEEQQALDDLVAPLTGALWACETPSPGWTVADQVGHLAYFDRQAHLAITDPDTFAAGLGEFAAAAMNGLEGLDEMTLREYRALIPGELLKEWRTAREALIAAAAQLDAERRVPWYGPSMGARSFITARMMETWAHGQDIVDALDLTRPDADRLQHVARLGFLTRGWSYQSRGKPVPSEPVRLQLKAPGGETWRLGPDEATSVVAGPAVDFCLVVVQRRHVDDTMLQADPLGREWLLIAQAFAGPPTEGPPPGTRPARNPTTTEVTP